MEILPSVLAWLDTQVRVAKSNISDAFTHPKETLERKAVQLTRGFDAMAGMPDNGEFGASPQTEKQFPAVGAGTFIAKGSPLWKSALEKTAEELLKAGKSDREIWADTRTWVSNIDGVWRQELDDSTFILNPRMIDAPSATTTIRDLRLDNTMEHPQLFMASPRLRATKAILKTDPEAKGAFYPGQNAMTVQGPNLSKIRSTTIHEVQHGLQDEFKMAKGGSPNFIQPEMVPHYQKKFSEYKAMGKSDAEAASDAAYSAYWHLAGEAEARLVQARLGYSAEKRAATFPEDDYIGVNVKDLILIK